MTEKKETFVELFKGDNKKVLNTESNLVNRLKKEGWTEKKPAKKAD